MSKTLIQTSDAAKASKRELKYGLSRSRDDLHQAFRLVYQSYYRAGLVVDKPSGTRLTPHHLQPTTEVLLAKLEGTVTSTVSIFGDGDLGLPMQSMYPTEVRQLREKGMRLAEIGCLADRRESPVRFIDSLGQLARLMAQVSFARGIDAVVAATHPKHARLYKRVMGFQQIGKLSDCPYANGNPAVALCLNLRELPTPELQQYYFGDPIPQKELVPYYWDLETREHFRRILQRDNTIASMAGIKGYYTWAAVTGAVTT